MRTVLSLLLVLFLSTELVSAQEIQLSAGKMAANAVSNKSGSDVEWVHITPQLIASETGQAALKEYHDLKNNGLLPARKGSSHTLGEKKNFWVLNIRTNNEESVEFTLMAEETRFNLWVETTELSSNGGSITASDISAMVNAVGNQTPSGSVDPTKGIVALDELIFGPPSDVDGNGKMEVLLHDIQDFYDPSGGNFSAVGGFFYPRDLISPNRKDIIHLDTMPGMYSQNGTPKAQTDVHQTLAHEYEHLIMQANKGNETALISEGQAEWAELANGYTPRTINYLSSAAERSRSLLSWRDGPPYGGPDSEDYQRGGLWTNYLAERLGWQLVWKFSRTNGTGATTYINGLNAEGLPISLLEDYVQGFHVANLINDGSKIPNFGYSTPARQGIQAVGINEIDGEAAVGTNKSGSVNSGSVVYQRWTNVGAFTLNLDTSNSSFRSDLRPILIFDEPNGTRSFEELSAGGEGVFKPGNFESVYLVVPHVDLANTSAIAFNYSASWEAYSGTSSFLNVAYDNGTVHHQVSGNSIVIIGSSVPSSNGSFGATDRFANRFDVPLGAALVEASVSMMFISDLNPSATNSSVKDFRLSIWNNNNSKPGSVVASDVFTYTGGNSAPELSFMTISLAPYQNVLKTLTGPVYISIENAGTDNNYMYFIVAYSSETTSPSYMFNRFGASTQQWANFDLLKTNTGQPSFPSQVLPIRGRIDLNAGSTSIDDQDTLPATVALDQNFPNPFNPSTSIQFSVPRASNVQLNVFDMLGRQVATLQNGMMQAGTHSVRFDASRFSSGLYLYTLQVGETTLTRTMTLIK